MALSSPRATLVRWLEGAIWAAAFVVLGVAFLLAFTQAAAWAPSAARTAIHHKSVAAEIGVVVIAAAALLALALRFEARGRWRIALAIGIATLLGLRLLAITVLPSPVDSDWAAYMDIGRRMLAGEGFWTARPPGWPLVLAGGFALMGDTPLAGELINLVTSVGVGLLLVALVRPTFGMRAAILALFAYGLLASTVLWTVILGVETLYGGLLVLVAVMAVAASRGAGSRRWALLLGIAFGLAQYVRASSQLLVPALLILPVLLGLPWRRVALLGIAVVAGFGLLVAPIVAWNAQVNDRVSVAPYLYDGWILYVGLSVAHGGEFNREDDASVWIATGLSVDGSTPAALQANADPFDPTRLADQRLYNAVAGRLGVARLQAIGPAIVPLEIRKTITLWQRGDQSAVWIYRHAPDARTAATRQLLEELSQVGWAVALFGSVVALVAFVRLHGSRAPTGPRPAEVTVVALLVLSTAILHLLAQVNPRFHEYLVPLLCGLAGVGFATLWARIRPATATGPVQAATGS
jgi:hypothetical protein